MDFVDSDRGVPPVHDTPSAPLVARSGWVGFKGYSFDGKKHPLAAHAAYLPLPHDHEHQLFAVAIAVAWP